MNRYKRAQRAAGLATACAMVFSPWPNGTADDCVLISEYGTTLHDPVRGEDNGTLYCSTGEVW